MSEKLELIVLESQYEGYFLAEIEAGMMEDDKELERWHEWIRGQTMAIHEGRSLVYRSDWEQWLAGRRPLD